MSEFTPKFHHLMVSIFLVVGFTALSAATSGRVIVACIVGAGSFLLVTGIVLLLLIIEGLNRRVEVMTEFANAIGKLDDEARAMMAFEFPHMEYHMKRGEVRAMFENTQVSIELFRLFLQTSNDRYISPRRDWCTTDQPEWAWIEIKGWLEAHDKIVPDSAAGPHSWLWKGNSYQHLHAYWMAGRKLINMSDRIYAQDEDEAKLA